MPLSDRGRRLRRYAKTAVTESAVRLGLFRRLRPLSSDFGFPRGKPIDRHFIDGFLTRHRDDIAGRVLEGAGGFCYGRELGGERVTRLDLMAPGAGIEGSNLVADLATGDGIAPGAYDCLLLTQVYSFIFDVRAAAANSRRALGPGGVLLATLPGIAAAHRQKWSAQWRFTEASAARLFGEAFGPENVAVESHGNVFAACALLQCLAAEDLSERELAFHDPEYPVTVTVRATA